MSNHDSLTEWALSRGYKLNGIKAHAFAGRGLGVIAERNIEVGNLQTRILLCRCYLVACCSTNTSDAE